MQAVSTGKVVNPYDRDQEQGWDHVDFVIDALLAEGNSGSPVLAASCKTRDLELVGVYHAGYKGHGALNVVVGIDQLVDFMHKKRRMPHALAEEGPGAPTPADRARVEGALSSAMLPLFDFGGLVVRAETTGPALLYHFYGRQFPLDDRRVAVIEDLRKEGAFGELGRLWVTGPNGWREWKLSALGADERDLLIRVADSVRLAGAAHDRLPQGAGQSGFARRPQARPRAVAHHRARRAGGARPGRQPAGHRRSAVAGARHDGGRGGVDRRNAPLACPAAAAGARNAVKAQRRSRWRGLPDSR